MAMLITDLYFDKNAELIKFFKNFDFYGITTDGWTAKAKKKALISLTIHYLNKNFELNKISLGTISADYVHNADNLCQHLNLLLSKYGILDKVMILVTDHASTMGKLGVLMDRDFYGCIAHLLNLICKLFFDCSNKV